MLWSKSRLLAALGLSAVLVLGACGYRPLYGDLSTNTQVTAHMAAITVAPIKDRRGQMMRTALKRRLNQPGNAKPLYTLTVGLSESLQRLAEQRSGFVTRANLTLSAHFTLTRRQDQQVLTEGDLQAVSSYNILDSDFATIAARDDARERAIQALAEDVRTRLAIFFQRPGQPGTRTAQ